METIEKKHLENLLLLKSKNYLLLDDNEKVYITDIFYKNLDWLSEETLLMVILNFRIPFFKEFSPSQKDIFIDMLLKRNFNDVTILSSIIDFFGVVFKYCSNEAQTKICEYLNKITTQIYSSPYTIMAICNFVWVTFKSLTLDNQKKWFEQIRFLLTQDSYPFLYDTINYTYHQISK